MNNPDPTENARRPPRRRPIPAGAQGRWRPRNDRGTGCAALYLPPYSPDLNPIEQAFAKLKALLRKVAARTLNTLETAIAAALDAFAPDECANYFTAAGYEPQ